MTKDLTVVKLIKKLKNVTYRYECRYVSSYQTSDENVSHKTDTDTASYLFDEKNVLILAIANIKQNFEKHKRLIEC